jgi:hypothetical protein
MHSVLINDHNSHIITPPNREPRRITIENFFLPDKRDFY